MFGNIIGKKIQHRLYHHCHWKAARELRIQFHPLALVRSITPVSLVPVIRAATSGPRCSFLIALDIHLALTATFVGRLSHLRFPGIYND